MEQFDITEFARMFDAALASDNPAVKKALRNFIMVAAIVHAEDNTGQRIAGPLETLVKKVANLESVVMELQKKIDYNNQKDQYYKDYYNTNPTWVYQPYITSVSTTSGKTWTDSLGYTGQDLSELMKDLRFNDKS